MMSDQSRGFGQENQTLVRGALKKELYSSEKAELERKRREMKSILDKQVEQRRRQKQMQKLQLEKLNQMEEDKIKEYFSRLEKREKTNSSGGLKKFSHNEINSWKAERKVKSKGRYTEKTIPVSVLSNDSKGSTEIQQNLEPTLKEKAKSRNISYNSVGDLLLLDLSPEENLRREQKPKARKKSLNKQEKKKRLFDENSERADDKEEAKEANSELSCQNQELKQQLKKNQEAISVLLGGMKSNKIMKKYQAKAEKILNGKAEQTQQKIEPKSEELKEEGMLPSLKLHHQSMMHDYILGCAKRASMKKMEVSK